MVGLTELLTFLVRDMKLGRKKMGVVLRLLVVIGLIIAYAIKG